MFCGMHLNFSSKNMFFLLALVCSNLAPTLFFPWTKSFSTKTWDVHPIRTNDLEQYHWDPDPISPWTLDDLALSRCGNWCWQCWSSWSDSSFSIEGGLGDYWLGTKWYNFLSFMVRSTSSFTVAEFTQRWIPRGCFRLFVSTFAVGAPCEASADGWSAEPSGHTELAGDQGAKLVAVQSWEADFGWDEEDQGVDYFEEPRMKLLIPCFSHFGEMSCNLYVGFVSCDWIFAKFTWPRWPCHTWVFSRVDSTIHLERCKKEQPNRCK